MTYSVIVLRQVCWVNSPGFEGHVSLKDAVTQLPNGPFVQLCKGHFQQKAVTWGNEADISQAVWYRGTVTSQVTEGVMQVQNKMTKISSIPMDIK